MRTHDNVSSNTLFHFTDKEALISILTDEFIPHYSNEEWTLMSETKATIHIPMVCFCDLPLSKAKYHINTYGKYGIGLNKDWARRKGITPVLYTYKQSLLMNSLSQLIQGVHGGIIKEIEGNNLDTPFKNMIKMCMFVKLYEVERQDKTGTTHNLRYYDEREWRFVPVNCDNFLKNFVDYNKSPGAIGSKKYQNLTEKSKISFDPNDIKYIVVNNDDDILPIAESLECIKYKYPSEFVKKLISRIITCNQINDDF